jgi:hypothetical protein
MSRSLRRKNRAQKQKAPARIPTILIGLFVLMGSGLLIKYVYFGETRPKIDEASLCPTTGPTSVNVILVDISDPLPEPSRIEANLLLSEIALSIPKHGLLDIRQLLPSSPFQRSIFAKCNPGDGTDLSFVDSNPDFARRTWETSFSAPVRRSFETSLAPSNAESSPIMGAIQRIAIERFLPISYSAVSKQLVIVSDMFESTPIYSQYSKVFDFEKFKKSQAFAKFQTDLRDASVKIYYVQRGLDYSDIKHIQFWELWISANHGQLDLVKKLQGAGK